MPRLSIVILNWNVADLLESCLQSLPQAAGDWWSDTEVILVDNASTDASLEMVRMRFPNVRIIALTENKGFSSGNNIGIQAAQAPLVFLLNPDTVAHYGSIAALAEYLEEHPDTGIVGPRLLNPDGTLQSSRRRFPTLATALIESTPLQRRFPNASVLRKFYMLDKPDNETQQVGWLSGAALMCRQEALSQGGMFDPGYFMFSEEVDLCRRLSDTGWRIVYLPEAEITHYGGQSTDQDVPARHIHFNTSKVRYFRIHEGRMVGKIVRYYLLGMYAVQTASEAAKWLLGHKRPLRAERVKAYVQVLRSGLREHKRKADRQRALLITGEYPPAHGGVGDYTCKLRCALEGVGVSTEVLTGSQGSGVRDQGSEIGGEAVDIPLAVGRITLSAVRRALVGSRSSIAHIQYQTGAFEMRPTINLMPWLLKRKSRAATVVTFHDLLVPYLFPKAGPVREWVNRFMARNADAVIATNPADADRLRSWGARRVKLIPIGSNIPNSPPNGHSREAWRTAQDIGQNTNLLAYFGFLNSTKGLDDLLRALSTLKTQGDFRLMIVGGGIGASDPTNRATAAAVDKLASDLGVQDELIWTGFLPPQEVSAALLSADMAVLPYADGASFRRGSLLAALEHGLPVVTTMGGEGRGVRGQGSDEGWPVLTNEENALLVESGDSAALASAVQRLAEDSALRTRLSAGAQQLARFFSWDRIARMHVELYEELESST